MKSLFLTLVFFLNTQAWAISDFDRAILFGANAVSMGTYIAQMEGEIAKIKLNYEKKAAEFQRSLETDYQAYLKETLKSELEYLKNQKAEYSKLYLSLQNRNAGFNKIVDLANAIYKGLLTRDSILVELKRLNEAYPGAESEWLDLLQKSFGSADSENLMAAQYEVVRTNATRLYADSKGLEIVLEDQISLMDLRISNTAKQLKDLP
jgi:hypothetical protein